MISFNQFLPVVHPVDVTDLRPFLREKLIITPYIFIGFQPNFGTDVCFNKPFMCIKF